jgi:predicted metal-dependent hydrolase
MTSSLSVDGLTFQLRRSPRRKTLQITVDREAQLVVSAPEDVDRVVIEDFIREKQSWLYTKLAEKEAVQQKPMSSREFVSGEGFHYLGRSHRLLLVEEQDVPLKLHRGRFQLRRAEAGQGRDHFIRWYSSHATDWISRTVARISPRLSAVPRSLKVKDLGFRWGSCSREGNVNFHWATILLPPSAIEYVVTHELIHLSEKLHTPEFWRRLERAMPDYQSRKRWLAEHAMALLLS